FELAAEQLALHRHADRSNVDDRELAGEQLADVDLHALDGARELKAADALDPGHLGRKRQHEVGWIGLNIRPLDTDLRDADWQPAWPLEGVTSGRADADEDTEPGLCLKASVAEEGEVARLARQLQPTDVHDGADRLEGDHLVRRAGTGIHDDALR